MKGPAGWVTAGALLGLLGSGILLACTTAGGLPPLEDAGPEAGTPVLDGSFGPEAGSATPEAGEAEAAAEASTPTDGGEPGDAGAEASSDAEPPKDAGPQCRPDAGEQCALDPQCGCASTQTCDITGYDTPACVLSGTAPAGHACTITQACARGLTCFNGACRPYCTTSGDKGCAKLDGGGSCVQIISDDGGDIPGYEVCSFHCSLLDPNACGPTGDLYAGCVPDNSGGTDCALVGIVDRGGDCSVSFCKPSLDCVGITEQDGSTTQTCQPWCRVGHSPSDCGDAGTCQKFTPSVTAYGVEYGVCL